MADKISSLFQLIDKEIAGNLQSKVIDSYFQDARNDIDSLELEDGNKYVLFRYQYHVKKASYLKLIDRPDEARKEQQFVGYYNTRLQKTDQSSSLTPDTEPVRLVTNDSTAAKTNTSEATPSQMVVNQQNNEKIDSYNNTNLNVEIQKLLDSLKKSSDDKIIELIDTIEKSIDDFIQQEPIDIQTWKNYNQKDTICSQIRQLLSVLKTSDTTTMEEQKNQASSQNKVVTVCIELDQLVCHLLYLKRVSFAEFLSSDKVECMNDYLFPYVPFTEERIVSHSKKLILLFHPDKAETAPHKVLFREVFERVITERENLLSQLTEKTTQLGAVEYYKSEGYKLWKLAVDYKNLLKGKRMNLYTLDAAAFANFTSDELEFFKREYALRAYEQYRAAAYAAKDLDTKIKDKVELLKYMALSLMLAGGHDLEAQIYFIAAVHTLIEETGEDISGSLRELQGFLDRLKNKDRPFPQATESESSSASSFQMSQVPNKEEKSLTRQGSIANNQIELRRVVLTKCLLRGSEAKMDTSEEMILKVKRKGFQYTGKAIATGVCGTVLGLVGLAEGLIDVAAIVGIGAVTGVIGGPVGIALGAGGGIVTLVCTLLLGRYFHKKSVEFYHEPKIRETLNRMMTGALAYYKQQQFNKFLLALSEEYTKDEKLIEIVRVENNIVVRLDPKVIITALLNHDFRPDGIAYLLVLIGEALLSGPNFCLINETDNLNQPARSTLTELAIQIYMAIQNNQELESRALSFDSHVQKNQLKPNASQPIRWLQKININTVSYRYSIPQEYFTEALEKPFFSRLDECRQVASLNYAIAHIITGANDNLRLSYAAVAKLKQKIAENRAHKFFLLSATRIKALDDLLAAFGYFEKHEPYAFDNRMSLESVVELQRIKKFRNSNGDLRDCEHVIALSETMTGLEALRTLLRGFPEFHGNLNNFYDSSELIFDVDHLSNISEKYQIELHRCIVESHCAYGHLFASFDDRICHNQNSPKPRIHIVLSDSNRKEIIGVFVLRNWSLQYFHYQLGLCKGTQLEGICHQQVAEYYESEAIDLGKKHNLLALPKWQSALNHYEKALSLNRTNNKILLKKANCLIMLSKYGKAESCLRDCPESNSAEFWYLLALAKRNLGRYDEAHYAISKAPHSHDTDNELKLIERVQKESKVISQLRKEPMKKRIDHYKNMKTCFENRISSVTQYNIVSIDGGGIRGIIPAVWCCELERLTKRSCASLFHMMAGTSTGAIICAGLSAHNIENSSEPLHTAASIVQLYVTESKNIFSDSKRNALQCFLQEPKYTDEGRKKLFEHYFGDRLISKSLTDLVIPAARADSNCTHLFTTREAIYDSSKNYQIKDVLMCTTAAPTYFSPYRLNNSSTFVDGGVQANNPTMAAYDEALRYGFDPKKIFIWSLGTGDYVPDALNPTQNRNLLFWYKNNKRVTKVIFDGPQNNLDCHMSHVLADRYYRWQLWLENPVDLDDAKEDSIEKLFNLARAHIEEMEAYDGRNRLGVLIDRLRNE